MKFTLKNKDDITFFISITDITTNRIQIDLFQPNTEYRKTFYMENTIDLLEITKTCINQINKIYNFYN